MQASFDFSGRTALVIGGTAGIGLAAARAFAAAGANVAIAGLPSGESTDIVAELGAERTLLMGTDVARNGDVEAAVARTAEWFGRIDVAVNNAGVSGDGRRIHDIGEEEYDRIAGINLKGIWRGMKHQVAHMLASGGGAIVNTTSTTGIQAIPRQAIYSATKHGVIGMTKSAALELAQSNIRVNAVAPGAVRTAIFGTAHPGRPDAADEFAKRVPMKRLGSVDEIAQGILWLSSDSASYVIGHTLVVDGGLTLV